jgi:exopolysaccharide biosynthesis polyprenyl glycosylphosphotransferase
MIDQHEAIHDQDEAARRGRLRLVGTGDRREVSAPHGFVIRRGTLRRVLRVTALLGLDFIGVCGAMLTAMLIKLLVGSGELAFSRAWGETKGPVTFAFLVTVLMFARVDLYGERARRGGLAKIAQALFLVAVISLVFALANGQRFTSYYVFYGSLVFAIAYVTGLRAVYQRVTERMLARAGYRRRTLLVGSGEHLYAVASAMGTSPGGLVDLVGFLDPTGSQASNGLRSLGGLERLGEVLGAESVQDVVIADPEFPHQQALELVDSCHQRGVTVHVAPSTMEILLDRAEFVPGQTLPLFTLRPPVFEGVAFAVKRTFDLVLSTVILVGFTPLLVAIGLAVRLSGRGPVLYRSIRPGIAGRPFACLKFRTMHPDAEQSQAALEDLNESTGALFKIRDDPRLTRVGRLLRRYSLDELPQLVNVLRGEMSLVGPRPLPMRDYHRLQDWHKKRYLVLPGITGLWQVSGRSELDFDDLVRLDFLYLERWSILLDLTILAKTLPAVITRRGAY